jgi:hypothetical protein
MIFKKNKYLLNFLVAVILASCSTTSKNFNENLKGFITEDNSKNFEDLYSYQSFSIQDLEKIQKVIDSQTLDQKQQNEAILLKKNYQKILSKESYSLALQPDYKYSKELIELIYKLNLPIKILWNKTDQITLHENLLSQKINGFCFSLYEDAIQSINSEISKNSAPLLIIYAKEFSSYIEDFAPANKNFMKIQYDSSNFQEFSAEVLGVKLSEKRFKKIDSLNPNQNLNFSPRPRSDFQQVLILLNPQEYKSMIPALKYHGGNRFQYISFISSLEAIKSAGELIDLEDSWAPISFFMSSKINKDRSASLQGFLEVGALNEWLLLQIFRQAGVRSAEINSITGKVIYKSNVCTKRAVPLVKISTDLFLS